MLNPIRKTSQPFETCEAHLVPQALNPQSWTVVSDRAFDSDFGRYNDAILVDFVHNRIEGKENARVHVFDPNNPTKLVTKFRTKTKIVVDSRTNVRNGSFTITYPKGTSDAWREAHLGDGSLVYIAVNKPSSIDNARVALSMLHSAYLTIYYHLGEKYIKNANTDFICDVLLESLTNQLPNTTFSTAIRFSKAINRLIAAYPPNDYKLIIHKALQQSRHPILLFRMKEHSFFGAVLPYDKHFVSLYPMPGFGQLGRIGLDNFLDLGNSEERIPIERISIGLPCLSKGPLTRDFWDRNAK